MKREALWAVGWVAVLFLEALLALLLSWIVEADTCTGNALACDETFRNALRVALIVVPVLYATLYVIAARRARRNPN